MINADHSVLPAHYPAHLIIGIKKQLLTRSIAVFYIQKWRSSVTRLSIDQNISATSLYPCSIFTTQAK